VFRVEPIIQRTWEALRAEHRSFSLETDGPEQLAVGDPDRLEQVLWAVLDNAVKYSPPQSPIAVRVTAQGDAREIVVIDHGPGMSAEVRDQAFDQFFRSAEARRAVPDGSGIGLYAARGLLEAMGGSIRLESATDAGTTVRIRLPAEPIPPDEG
jgi:signal transduction histidine kinase